MWKFGDSNLEHYNYNTDLHMEWKKRNGLLKGVKKSKPSREVGKGGDPFSYFCHDNAIFKS